MNYDDIVDLLPFAMNKVSLETLGSLPFFSPLTSCELSQLLDSHCVVAVPAGRTLVSESDWGANLMVVLKG